MHFIYVRAKGAGNDIPWALMELGHQVSSCNIPSIDPLRVDSEVLNLLSTYLSEQTFDYIISYLFIPELSDICQQCQYTYIAWIYDSPLITLFSPAACNPCNHIFVFDHSEYLHLKERNIPHLYYLPLGVNINRTGALNITEEDEQRFSCDISFVGNLYENNSYNKCISLIPEEISAELKLYLLKNLCNWNTTKPWPSVSPRFVAFAKEHLNVSSWRHDEMDLGTFLGIMFMSRKLAEMDRITVLNELSTLYPVDFYTKSTTSHLQSNVRIHPPVDYQTDMNKVFYLSRINLNITLPSIETGLPQRIFDIMGCGGFVMTNYQAELDEYFTIGKDIEAFRSIDELKDKVSYYLSHEKERLRIAINGYKNVRDNFSYTKQIQTIINLVTSEDS